MQYCNFLLKKRVANNLFISVVEERSGDFGYIITHFIALNVFILAAQTPSQGKLFFFCGKHDHIFYCTNKDKILYN